MIMADISETVVGVQISAPPMDGEANAAIVKYFAELLKVKKATVSLRVSFLQIFLNN